jgi:hypothetical protein
VRQWKPTGTYTDFGAKHFRQMRELNKGQFCPFNGLAHLTCFLVGVSWSLQYVGKNSNGGGLAAISLSLLIFGTYSIISDFKKLFN